MGATVRPGERLLPQLLRERGYSTAAVVSGSRLQKDTGINQGFDFFDDEMPPNPEEPAGYPGAAGRRRIGEDRRALARQRRHVACVPVSPLERAAQAVRATGAVFASTPPYDGEIAYADEIVGRLIQYLKKHQLYDRSTIVLLSDHGEGLGDHGEQEHGLFVYDEAIRVPLIIKQESNVGAGRRISDLVQHVDLVPTILDLVKAPVPDNLRGRSLKPLLEDTGRLRERPVYAEALYAHNHFGWSE